MVIEQSKKVIEGRAGTTKASIFNVYKAGKAVFNNLRKEVNINVFVWR
ncbi:hypothetical protein ACIQW7_21240 [Peribacillus simplex]